MCIYCALDGLKSYGELVQTLETLRFAVATVQRFNLRFSADEMNSLKKRITDAEAIQKEAREKIRELIGEMGFPEPSKLASFLFDGFTKAAVERIKPNEHLIAAQIEMLKREGVFEKIKGFQFLNIGH